METIEIASLEILEIALKKERDEKRFYSELADYVTDSNVQEFMRFMADASADHENEIKKLLGGIEAKTCARIGPAVKKLNNTNFQTDIFPPLEDIIKIATGFKGIRDVLDFALETERVAAEFYGILGKYCDNFFAKTALLLLEKIELEHVAIIESFREEFLMKSDCAAYKFSGSDFSF